MSTTAPGSVSRSALIRYVAPALVLASGLGLSALAASKAVGPQLGLLPRPLALWLLPAVSVLVLVGVRLSSGATDRTGDLLLFWVSSFPVVLHVLHLMFGLGLIQTLERAVAWGVAALDLGLAMILPALPLGSPLGLRLPRLLRSEPGWRLTHRALGLGFLLASLAALASAWLPAKVGLFVYLLGPVIALGLGFVVGLATRVEEAPEPDRPKSDHETPGDAESSP